MGPVCGLQVLKMGDSQTWTPHFGNPAMRLESELLKRGYIADYILKSLIGVMKGDTRSFDPEP